MPNRVGTQRGQNPLSMTVCAASCAGISLRAPLGLTLTGFVCKIFPAAEGEDRGRGPGEVCRLPLIASACKR